MANATIPLHDVDPDEAAGLAEDIGFGRAILLGSVAGIVAFSLLVAATVFLVARSMDVDMAGGALAAISIWTGVWAGLFLGGTVAVGRWSASRH